jgi:hypothetical protein
VGLRTLAPCGRVSLTDKSDKTTRGHAPRLEEARTSLVCPVTAVAFRSPRHPVPRTGSDQFRAKTRNPPLMRASDGLHRLGAVGQLPIL